MAILSHGFGVSAKANKGLNTTTYKCWPYLLDSDNVASTKDPQFFRRFQIFCGSHSTTPHPIPPLLTHFRICGSHIGS